MLTIPFLPLSIGTQGAAPSTRTNCLILGGALLLVRCLVGGLRHDLISLSAASTPSIVVVVVPVVKQATTIVSIMIEQITCKHHRHL